MGYSTIDADATVAQNTRGDGGCGEVRDKSQGSSVGCQRDTHGCLKTQFDWHNGDLIGNLGLSVPFNELLGNFGQGFGNQGGLNDEIP